MTSSFDRRAMLLLLVLSGVIISICMGLRQSLGIFMRPMTVELGISAATFGFSMALQNIVWGLSQPFVGAIPYPMTFAPHEREVEAIIETFDCPLPVAGVTITGL